MSKRYRIILFILSIGTLIAIGLIIEGNLNVLLSNFWFSSGLLLLILLSLIDQPHFSKDSNIFVNAVTAAVSLLLVKLENRDWAFWLFTVTTMYLLISSYTLMLVRNNPLSEENKVVQIIARINRLIGKPETLFSAFFLWGAIKRFTMDASAFNLLLWYWIIFTLLNIPQLAHTLENIFNKNMNKKDMYIIGQIFGVQSKKIFLVKLYEDRVSIKKYDNVKFRYSMQDSKDFVINGIVFDTYLLNQEKWAKILQLAEPKKEDIRLEKNIVYKLKDTAEIDRVSNELKVNSLVGVVIDGSTIGKIKFEYSKKNDDLQEGDLLELFIGRRRLFYQVIGGITEKERLEERNETGFIEGEAIQLGEWRNTELSFQKFGWVPSINTPLFKADTTDITIDIYNYPDYKLGVIPGTSLPSIINLNDAVSHHMALLGVTGSGKSYLGRKIINKLLVDTKVICIDFTGEWEKECDREGLTVSILTNKTTIDAFLNGDSQVLGLIELPTLSNTVEVVKKTEELIDTIFTNAKVSYDAGRSKKVCLVLEEAHTIVPEEKFLGVNNWDCKAIVNKISQIALQGRKYGVGLLVLAQRTANVSKTVLTQCNTVICFQAFDETSFNFLGNYVGKEIVQTLPNLKQYHAVVAGKAIKSNVPMIIDMTSRN